MANSPNAPKRSAFDGLIAARKPLEIEEPPTPPVPIDPVPAVRGPGRPAGKKSDPDYVPATGYVRRDTYKSVRMALLDKGQEFSELMQELLEQWLSEEGRG